ncbi:TraR/DksA C4-type zinc finger protein [soil metagenome]
MPPLTPQQVEDFAAELQRERDDLAEQGRRTATELADVRAARSDGSADDEHDPEGSTLSSDWSRLYGFSRAITERVEAIERAIARIDEGTYGVCIRCGRQIETGRLEARPAAELCIECAREVGR